MKKYTTIHKFFFILSLFVTSLMFTNSSLAAGPCDPGRDACINLNLSGNFCSQFIIDTSGGTKIGFIATGCKDVSDKGGSYGVIVKNNDGLRWDVDLTESDVDGQYTGSITISNPGNYQIEKLYEKHQVSSQSELDQMITDLGLDPNNYDLEELVEKLADIGIAYEDFEIGLERIITLLDDTSFTVIIPTEDDPPPPAPVDNGVNAIFCETKTGIQTGLGCLTFLDPTSAAASVANIGIGIGAGVALIILGISSFMITTSQGDPRRLQSAKELFAAAIIGIIMLVLSAFILNVIGVRLFGLF